MATAQDVAAAIIERQREAGRSVDKMQLQKLLYLVQGAHLAWFGEPAFTGEFRAYRNGPVERGVEQTYTDVSDGRDPLPGPVAGHPEALPRSVVDTVTTILETFGGWDGPRLESYTKIDGSPWMRVRGDLPASAPSARKIPNDLLLDWFTGHGVFPRNDRRARNARS